MIKVIVSDHTPHNPHPILPSDSQNPLHIPARIHHYTLPTLPISHQINGILHLDGDVVEKVSEGIDGWRGAEMLAGKELTKVDAIRNVGVGESSLDNLKSNQIF